MRSKEQLLETLRNILQDNDISVYSLAKITGINRSTLQKALSGARPLTPRQFKTLLDALPLSAKENTFLFTCFLETVWDSERIAANCCMLDILSTISSVLCDEQHSERIISNLDLNNIQNVYSDRRSVNEIMASLLLDELDGHSEPKISLYLPLYSDNITFTDTMSHLINSTNKHVEVSVLFEFLKTAKYSSNANLHTLKRIIPMVMDTKERYNMFYFYVDDYIHSYHPTPYPYYVILTDRAIMLDSELENAIVLSDKSVVAAIAASHSKKTKEAAGLKTTMLDLSQDISFLMDNHIADTEMYAITYEPCISSFVPPDMYAELISDDMPGKTELLSLVASRLSQLTDVPAKYCLFNKNSLSDFVREGNIIPFKHPHLKMCTLEQRKAILTNIYNAMDDKKVVLRAFSQDKINVAKNYELTDIQNNFNFQILVYSEDATFRLITINEPIISRTVIGFFKDIVETHFTFTFEQTKALVKENIDLLDKMIDEKQG